MGRKEGWGRKIRIREEDVGKGSIKEESKYEKYKTLKSWRKRKRSRNTSRYGEREKKMGLQ